MARNEEKQLGKLNRLWLQREKEEGRLRSVSWDRPRLSALHTAAEVKRWIPGIKREMEYYLEQSQLIHYSERKIEEFQEKLEALKKEYQSHLWKLRRLDPACKEHPWKPRGYTRKRTADGKLPSWVNAGGRPGDALLSTPVSEELSDPDEDDESRPRSTGQEVAGPDLSSIQPQGQDAPLEFSIVRSHPRHVWQRSSYNTGGDTATKLKDILLSEQPEHKGISAVGKSMVDRTAEQRTAGKSMVDRTAEQRAAGKSMVDRTAEQRAAGKSMVDRTAEQRAAGKSMVDRTAEQRAAGKSMVDRTAEQRTAGKSMVDRTAEQRTAGKSMVDRTAEQRAAGKSMVDRTAEQRTAGKSMVDRTAEQRAAGKSMVDRTAEQRAAGKSMVDRTAEQPSAGLSTGILGLDCYSSSEGED